MTVTMASDEERADHALCFKSAVATHTAQPNNPDTMLLTKLCCFILIVCTKGRSLIHRNRAGNDDDDDDEPTQPLRPQQTREAQRSQMTQELRSGSEVHRTPCCS